MRRLKGGCVGALVAVVWAMHGDSAAADQGQATGHYRRADRLYAFAEAEGLKCEQCEVKGHFVNWYYGAPSGGRMLRARKPGARAWARLEAKAPGKHVVWVRYLSWRPFREAIAVRVRQGGRERAGATLNRERIVPRRYRARDYGFFVWERVPVELEAGEVEVEIVSPDRRGWHLDCLLLTDDADYTPDVRDFAPAVSLRFTNLAAEPRCLRITTVWKQRPWRGYVGYVGAGGMSRRRPRKPEGLLAPNAASPWIQVNRWLLPRLDNILHVEQYTAKGEASDFRGVVEVAVGEERKAVRRYEIARDGCRFTLVVPLDLSQGRRLKADYEFVEDRLAYVKTLPKPKGRPPSKILFATSVNLARGKESEELIAQELSILKRLGFNALWTSDLTRVEKHGFLKAATHRFVWHVCKDWPPGCRFQPDADRMARYFAEQRDRLGPEHLGLLSVVTVMDEPGSVPFAHFAKCPVCQKEFVSYLGRGKVAAAELGLDDLSQARVTGPDGASKAPALYYHSQHFRHYATTEYFRACRRAVEQVMPAHVKTSAALADAFVYTGKMLDRINWFDLYRRDALNCASCGSWINLAVSDQLMNYVLAVMRAATRVHGQPWLIYSIIQSQEPLNFQLKTFAILAYGAKFVDVFDYGPYYMKNGDYFSHRRDGAYEAVQDVIHTVGAAEDLLAEARPVKGSVAVLFSETTDVWMVPQKINNYGREREGVFLALRHAQLPVDILTEADVAGGVLKDYRVLYLVGSHILPKAATAIRQWVEQGGVLWSDLGSGLKDHYDRKLDTLWPVYGLKDWSVGSVRSAGPGKPGMLSCRKPVAEVELLPARGLARCRLQAYFGQGQVTPAGDQAEVLARYGDGRPAALVRRYGKGTSIHCAFWPGLTYFKEALPEKLPPGGAGRVYSSFFPTAYPRSVRDLIACAARWAKAERPVVADAELVEATLQTCPRGAVVTLINYSLKPISSLAVQVRAERRVRAIVSARHGALRFSQAAGQVRFALPLAVGDFVSVYFATD